MTKLYQNLGNYESRQEGLPIHRLDTSKIVSTPPTQKQIDRSNEMVKQGLPEELRQIEFHLGNAKENLTNSQEAVANCDTRLVAIEVAIAKLRGMTLTGLGQRKLDEVLEQKEKVTVERQHWIRQVGKYTGITKTWQDRRDVFDFQTLKELRAEEEALAAINL